MAPLAVVAAGSSIVADAVVAAGSLIDEAGLDALCDAATSDPVLPKDYEALKACLKRPAATIRKRPSSAMTCIMKRPSIAGAAESEDMFDDVLEAYVHVCCTCAAEKQALEKRVYSKVFHMTDGVQRKQWGIAALTRFRHLRSRTGD